MPWTLTRECWRRDVSEPSTLHLRAALHIESKTPREFLDLAYHFDAAGESQRALSYALAAAEQARVRHTLEIAEEQYRIAERSIPTARDIRYRIAEGLGDVLMLRGRYDEATRQNEAGDTPSGPKGADPRDD